MFSFLRREVQTGTAQIDMLVEEIGRDIEKAREFEVGILDRSATTIDGVLDFAKWSLDRLKAEKADCEARLADVTEKIRHHGLVIDIFGSAQKQIEANIDPPPTEEPKAVEPASVSIAAE